VGNKVSAKPNEGGALRRRFRPGEAAKQPEHGTIRRDSRLDLHYLKHVDDLSNEEVVERWVETLTGNSSVASNSSSTKHRLMSAR
jgi:hypothetical protein